MSLISTATLKRRPIWHVAIMIALAVVTVGLQIALPWISYSVAKRYDQAAWGKTETWDQFLVDRFRFYWLFKPTLLESKSIRFQSATVCGDELFALFAPSKSDDSDERCPMLRCHLKTGAISMSFAPPGIRYVLSDGEKIWWLPAYWRPISPFISEGRPAALVRNCGDRLLIQMIAFTQDHWIETEQFLVRSNEMRLMLDPVVRVQPINGRVVALRNGITQFHYCTDLELGTDEVAKAKSQAVTQAFNLLRRSAAVEQGWTTCFENRSVASVAVKGSGSSSVLVKPREYHKRVFSDLWFDQERLWTLRPALEVLIRGGTVNPLLGYLCEDLESVNETHYFVRSPLRWQFAELGSYQANISTIMNFSNNTTSRQGSIGDTVVVTGHGVDVYILNFNRLDGRIAVMQLIDQQARPIAETAEKIDWRCYLDAVVAWTMLFLIPTAVLVLLAKLAQGRTSSQRIDREGKPVELASNSRRSFDD